MKLRDITDPIRRALLDPEGCANEDASAAFDAGLIRCVDPGDTIRTPAGEALLAEAMQAARELSFTEVQHLGFAADDSGTRHLFFGAIAELLESKGLVYYDYVPGQRCVFSATPAGKLVLELRDRIRKQECV